MKLQTLILFISIITTSCSNNNTSKFTAIKCAPEVMPEFEGNKVSIIDDNGNPLRDTILEKIPKSRTVFKPCRDIIYRATFKSAENELISNSRIEMMATGKRWEGSPDIQDAVVIQYEFTNEDFKRNQKHQLNKSTIKNDWAKEVVEGVIENAEEVWMHPFRFNQFNFTEVAPFPEVKFPLEIGKTWTGNLNIQQGWGDWENTHGYFEYEITGKENINTRFGEIENCWKVVATSEYEFGKSKFDYWFSEKLGFVKMYYVNYGNQTLTIELEEVNEN